MKWLRESASLTLYVVASRALAAGLALTGAWELAHPSMVLT